MIDLELPDYLQELRTNIHSLSKSMFRPISRKYDIAEHEYPKELDVFRKMNVMGSLKKSKKKGKTGSEGSFKVNLTTVLATEELAWGDVALMMSIPNAAPGNASINAIANEKQMEEFGDKWAAFSITEPNSGSDPGSIITTAVRDGCEWVLNGEKIFVTCAERSDIVVVWATIDKNLGKEGIKPFIVPKGTPGLELTKLESKMGLRASDTGGFVLNNCRIPIDSILGSAEKEVSAEGFKGVMKTFDNTRPIVGAMATGVARAALDFVKEEFEKNGINLDYNANLNNISSIEREYYLMDAHIEALRLLSWRAAWMADSGEFNNVEASMAKAKGGRCGTLITQKCCELLGYLGYSQKYLVEKWMRDSKILDIFEGTGQIQHLIIARDVLGLSGRDLK